MDPMRGSYINKAIEEFNALAGSGRAVPCGNTASFAVAAMAGRRGGAVADSNPIKPSRSPRADRP
jgi:hypothetical protein